MAQIDRIGTVAAEENIHRELITKCFKAAHKYVLLSVTRIDDNIVLLALQIQNIVILHHNLSFFLIVDDKSGLLFHFLQAHLYGTAQLDAIHADVDAIERVEILRKLRAGKVDILVGINLLREGLDLPEVSLVCILDADKEGFLRNETSLVQTAGRAARHVHGECVLFCDVVTDSIRRLVEESDRRRAIQQAYNEAHGITPQSVSRGDQSTLRLYTPDDELEEDDFGSLMAGDGDDAPDVPATIARLEKEMREAAARLDFEVAAVLRDKINLLKNDKRH